MDITETLAPKSDQLNAADLAASGPRTFTVAGVSKGNPDQPVQVALAEFDRVWRPSKSMRRVLAAGWTANAATWKGKRVTLFCDPDVVFGGERVGGVRISHMSDIPKPLAVPLLVKRGKSAMFTVQPLTEAPRPAPTFEHEPTAEQVAECTDDADLRAWWPVSSPERQTQIKARAAELKGGAV